jgi:hypothetical protein
VIIAVGNDGQFAKYCEVAGRPGLATDPRFARNQDRVRNRAVLVPMLEELMKARPKAHWLAALEAAKVPCGAINNLAEVFADPARAERGMVHAWDHPLAPGVRLVASPLKLSATPVRTDLPPPLLGQHTDEVLARCWAGTRTNRRAAAGRRCLMAQFVLVHGAWHGGWCWQRVVQALAAEGHRVHAVTLTGVGERAHLLTSAITLETHIADVAERHRGGGDGPGRAGGALVRRHAGHRHRRPHAAARLRHLVYVDAVVPRPGESWSSTHASTVREARLAARRLRPTTAGRAGPEQLRAAGRRLRVGQAPAQTAHPGHTYAGAAAFDPQRVAACRGPSSTAPAPAADDRRHPAAGGRPGLLGRRLAGRGRGAGRGTGRPATTPWSPCPPSWPPSCAAAPDPGPSRWPRRRREPRPPRVHSGHEKGMDRIRRSGPGGRRAAVALLTTGSATAPASTFVLLDGSKRTTDDLKGKVTLVNFWATSCVTCVAEMPKIIATYDKYKARGYDTMAVAMSYDPPSYVVNYTETRKLPFQVAIDNTGASPRPGATCS